MKMILMSVLLVMGLYVNQDDKLLGRWETPPSPAGHVTAVVFRPDHAMEAFVNRKPFTSGKYSFRDGILTFTDTGCEGRAGEYNIVFFSNGDSLRFVPIADSCEERRQGMLRLVMGRVRKSNAGSTAMRIQR